MAHAYRLNHAPRSRMGSLLARFLILRLSAGQRGDRVQQILRGAALQNPTIRNSDGFSRKLRKTGKHDNWRSGIQLFDFAGYRQAVHSRHPVINDHRVDSVRPEEPQTFLPGGRVKDPIAFGLEQEFADFNCVGFIINAQDCR